MSVVYVRYGDAVTNSSEAISLVINGVLKKAGVYVRFNNETWENGIPVGCELTVVEAE